MPEGPGPHPTPGESQRKAAELERQYAASESRHRNPPLPSGDDMRGQPPALKGDHTS